MKTAYMYMKVKTISTSPGKSNARPIEREKWNVCRRRRLHRYIECVEYE